MTRKKLLSYTGLLVFLLIAGLAIYLAGRRVRLPYAEEMEAADRLHRQVTAAVKAERLARGCALAPEDVLEIGLIGAENSAITTSLGNLEAKRTSELPDMAALCVRLLHEAGVRKGDAVGACFSASFPGIDLALLCAAEVMELRIVYSASIGSSNYGANLPGYVLPEMIRTAVEAGLLSTMPQMVSLGGEGDEGRNMFGVLMEETEELDEMLSRLEAEGFTLLHIEDYVENVTYRMTQMGEIAAFVNVGGNALGTGRGEAVLSFGQGLLKASHPVVTAKSGMAERYLAQDVPVIHILNLKKLCAETGVPFDPSAVPETGSSELYYSHDYSRPAIAAVGLVTLAAACLIERDERRRMRARIGKETL